MTIWPVMGHIAIKTDIVVIGAGQAGLSTAYHLARQGLAGGRGFVVLDANAGQASWKNDASTCVLDRM